VKAAAAALLLLGLLRHYSWELVKPEYQAQVWNIVGSMVITIFLLALWSRETAPITIWWLAEESQTMVCGTWWILSPWEVKPGEAQCSSLLGFDLSTLGLLAVSLILAYLYVKTYRLQKKEKSP
jgi:hypothetical protein